MLARATLGELGRVAVEHGLVEAVLEGLETGAQLPSELRIRRRGPSTNASWANPIEAHFGPLRQFTLASSHHPNHTVQTRALQRYLRWRNQNVRHPDVLAAQRRERARVRSERGMRWGGRPQAAAV